MLACSEGTSWPLLPSRAAPPLDMTVLDAAAALHWAELDLPTLDQPDPAERRRRRMQRLQELREQCECAEEELAALEGAGREHVVLGDEQAMLGLE
ncbi:hypothetical protein WJX81_002022 [Elliptochloris bilobata]|uniref:Uncharacterized protein n=1 Tax=Elliptochloris bilobata TaxID=381761 RepID=A0AAW1QV31_9CHLO